MSFSFVKVLSEHSSCRAPAPSSSAPVTVSLSPNPNAPLCFVLLLLLYFTVAILSLPLYYYGSASVCFWRLYFVGALLADGDAKSNDGCRLAGPSSFGASSPQRALDGGGWRPDVPSLVSLSARREVIVSGDILVKLSPPALAPILLFEPSQFVGGWLTGRRSCEGWVDAIWLM